MIKYVKSITIQYEEYNILCCCSVDNDVRPFTASGKQKANKIDGSETVVKNVPEDISPNIKNEMLKVWNSLDKPEL